MLHIFELQQLSYSVPPCTRTTGSRSHLCQWLALHISAWGLSSTDTGHGWLFGFANTTAPGLRRRPQAAERAQRLEPGPLPDSPSQCQDSVRLSVLNGSLPGSRWLPGRGCGRADPGDPCPSRTGDSARSHPAVTGRSPRPARTRPDGGWGKSNRLPLYCLPGNLKLDRGRPGPVRRVKVASSTPWSQVELSGGPKPGCAGRLGRYHWHEASAAARVTILYRDTVEVTARVTASPGPDLRPACGSRLSAAGLAASCLLAVWIWDHEPTC